MVGWGWCSQVRASSELQFGVLREAGATREAGSTVTESLVVLYRVGTHQIRRRRRAARSSTSQGRAEPLCAWITSLNREVFEGKADADHGSFFFLRGPQGAANGQYSSGFFRDAQGFGRSDAGSRAGFTSSRPPPPWTSVFQVFICLYMCGLEKLGIVDQNWLERSVIRTDYRVVIVNWLLPCGVIVTLSRIMWVESVIKTDYRVVTVNWLLPCGVIVTLSQ